MCVSTFPAWRSPAAPQAFHSPSPGLPKALGSAAVLEQQLCSFSPALLSICRELFHTQMCCRQNLCVLGGEEGKAARAQPDEALNPG